MLLDHYSVWHGQVMCGAGCLVQLFWDWALILVIRYSGMRFLSGLWVLGFNPLSLDLAFIQIPFLEQVGSRDVMAL